MVDDIFLVAAFSLTQMSTLVVISWVRVGGCFTEISIVARFKLKSYGCEIGALTTNVLSYRTIGDQFKF